MKGRTALVAGATPKLSDRRALFVKELLADPKRNATEAARRAGYSGRCCHITAMNLMRNQWVMAEIEKHDAPRMHRLDITAEKVLRELAAIGFADMGDYLDFDAEGGVRINLDKVPEGGTKAIMEVTQESRWEGRGDDAEKITITKFKLHPKTQALELLARHLGILVQRHEHSGPDGGPIPMEGNVRIYFELPDNGRHRAAATSVLPETPLLTAGVAK